MIDGYYRIHDSGHRTLLESLPKAGGKTQKDLANAMGLTAGTVGPQIKGHRTLDDKSVKRYADFLACSESDFKRDYTYKVCLEHKTAIELLFAAAASPRIVLPADAESYYRTILYLLVELIALAEEPENEDRDDPSRSPVSYAVHALGRGLPDDHVEHTRELVRMTAQAARVLDVYRLDVSSGRADRKEWLSLVEDWFVPHHRIRVHIPTISSSALRTAPEVAEQFIISPKNVPGFRTHTSKNPRYITAISLPAADQAQPSRFAFIRGTEEESESFAKAAIENLVRQVSEGRFREWTLAARMPLRSVPASDAPGSKEKTVLHFSYGHGMTEDVMRYRAPSCQWLGFGKLNDYRPALQGSRDGVHRFGSLEGPADGGRGSCVWGSVFQITVRDMETRLDFLKAAGEYAPRDIGRDGFGILPLYGVYARQAVRIRLYPIAGGKTRNEIVQCYTIRQDSQPNPDDPPPPLPPSAYIERFYRKLAKMRKRIDELPSPKTRTTVMQGWKVNEENWRSVLGHS